MSYQTYITEALVCGSKENNTSDKNYLLFSPLSGMVWAQARSVREERSKQRMALQDFSHIRVSLVKGKSGWRIGSVEALGNFFLNARSRIERGLVNFVITQLRRYVHGEVVLQRIYDDAFEVCLHAREFSSKSTLIQQLFLIRLLSELGYIAPTPAWAMLIEADSVTDAVALYKDDMAVSIAKAVSIATEASHL